MGHNLSLQICLAQLNPTTRRQSKWTALTRYADAGSLRVLNETAVFERLSDVPAQRIALGLQL